MSKLAQAVQVGLRQCAGHATVADSPRGRGRTLPTEAHWGLLAAASQPALCHRSARGFRQGDYVGHMCPRVAMHKHHRP
eukprot:1712624-Alexandrium_andersonii.AAC.1